MTATTPRHLNAEEVEAAAVEYAERLNLRAIIVSEQAGKDGAQRAVDAVYANSADRIVDLELLIDKFDAEDNGKACDQIPMMAAPNGVTTSQPAVMATRPAREPFSVMETSGFL